MVNIVVFSIYIGLLEDRFLLFHGPNEISCRGNELSFHSNEISSRANELSFHLDELSFREN